MQNKREGGIYIHIPFCDKKCIYCDFYSAGVKIAQWDGFIFTLLNELKYRKNEINFRIETIYIGGGTPSLIPEESFIKLIQGLKETLDLSNIKEFTIEVNPEDINEKKCCTWKDFGINRISIGIQSLNDNELKACGRRHNAKKSLKGLEIVNKYFKNVSVDLIYGLPGQTIETLNYSLNKIMGCSPCHISVYNLMIEENTPLSVLLKKNKIKLPEEEEIIEMTKLVSHKLRLSGYRHYEISNYALPGKESKHNNSYWEGKPYIGLGPSAHSYDGERKRTWNPADLKGYLKFYRNNKMNSLDKTFYQFEILSETEIFEEFIMTRLRTSTGLDLNYIKEIFGESKAKAIEKKSKKYLYNNFLIRENESLKLTEEGILMSDKIILDLI